MLSSHPLDVHLLGGFRVVAGGRGVPDSAWRLRKGRHVIQLLALAPHLRLHREQIVDQLWPDADPLAAANSLHQVLHTARRALEPDLPRDRPSAYLRLHNDVLSLPPNTQIDVTRFEEAAARARAGGDEALCEGAIDLYDGDLLADDPYAEWAASRRTHLRELYLQVLAGLARLREARGDPSGAIDALDRLIASDATREDAHVGLMRLRAAQGDRAAALRQYELLRDVLRRELDAVPGSEARALHTSLLAAQPAALTTASAAPTAPAASAPVAGSSAVGSAGAPLRPPRRSNLPLPLTTFVGREREIEVLVAELTGGATQARLLTLTGAGGAGKSRLAVEVGRRVLNTQTTAFPDGVWYVDLDAVSEADAERVAQRTAAVLSFRLGDDADTHVPHDSATERLARAFESRILLLILDGCEHLARACAAFVTALITRCAGVHVLATSREPLRVPGERVWRVPSLSLPDPGAAPALVEWDEYDALRLFIERASHARPGFAPTPQNAGTLADLCRRLDGLPLAIELAAARTRVLTVDQIAERLGSRFDLLTDGAALPERHQTLLAAMDWSHSLLSEPERVLFRRLAAFDRGWTLDEAEAICAGDGLPRAQILDLLTQLVDKSLVVAETDPAGPTHFRMLETIREYAWGELLAAGELESVQQRLQIS